MQASNFDEDDFFRAIVSSGARALLCPAVELPDAGFLTLGKYLHRAIATVLYPPADTEAACFALSGRAKINALNSSSDHQL